MGIIGYGDIGVACATLAVAYGMNVVGLRKNPHLSKNDKLIDMVSHAIYHSSHLLEVWHI